ncbi:GntR family transcriptional regulator [Catenovulum maritimum]|uniref:GntR family transcriptional regulator n=1 Tax=Catenovulum maritimum TaxID=1513271 RepID=A0A0J8JNT2_9ALTE|nr:GntR family transcriptional regulator [Catenovulum maritimum]KMT66291.1 GntR family transcriptional regulator [Catenovulum maritimum]
MTKTITTNIPLAEKAYQVIREQILNNSYRAGEQILEKTLVETLAISRTPVREACVRLEKEGLIEIKPRHGIRVKPISLEDMAEIYEILTALESEAARKLATQNLKAADLKKLVTPTTAMEKALAKNDLEAWAEADEAFHLALVELSGNQRLKQVVLQFWGQAHRVRYFTLHLRDKPTGSTQDHIDLVNAIKAGNSELAASIHRNHRIEGKENLLKLLDKYRFVQL